MSSTPEAPHIIKVFYSYADQDEHLREELEKHLSTLKQQRLIAGWHHGNITPGKESAQEITQHLNTAHIILLLVSADFLASDFCYGIEMKRAMQRHQAGEARIVPILLRPADYTGAPFGTLAALPSNGQAVSLWQNQDQAFAHIAESIRTVVQEMQAHSPTIPSLFVSPESSDTRQTASPLRFWNVPYERNPYFTGREQVLQTLHNALLSNRAAALTQIQAISGLGGIGKTQTAVEYAYRYRHEYNSIFWTKAASEVELQTGFIEIARLIDLPEQDAQKPGDTVKAVRRWLEHSSGWLLIFDNADDPAILKAYRPQHAQGHILLTSRAYLFDTLAIVKPIALQEMPPPEAVAFLFKRTEREDTNALEQQAAAQLAAELGYLPLALEQASAYIAAKTARFQDYLTSYRNHPLTVLNKSQPHIGDYPASVATTWTINFREVEHTPAAADLLRLSAFLSPERIPLELLTQGAPALSPALATILNAVDEDPLVLNETFEPLTRYSLIRRDVDTHTYHIHRLVQEVIKDGMDAQSQCLWAERTVRAVNASFPSVDTSTWPLCQRYLPHALVCAAHITHWDITFPEATNLLDQVGDYFYQHAQHEDAEPLLKQALTICERVLGAEHPDTAGSLNNLAILYKNQGKYEQAEPLYQRALAVYERVLGAEHPNTAGSLHNLASLYSDQGKYEQAEPLYQRALAIKERMLGAEHPDTASSLNNLALLYSDQGKYEQAGPLHQRALTIRERVLGAEHPDTARSLNNLALLYSDQGKYEQAEPLYQRALAIKERMLGAEHPDTASSLNNLALLYYGQGKYEQAEPLYQRALAVYERMLGAEHPTTVRVRKNLTNLRQAMQPKTE